MKAKKTKRAGDGGCPACGGGPGWHSPRCPLSIRRNPGALHLVPAFGRDYKSKAAVQADLVAGKDFIIQSFGHRYDGKPTNLSDLLAGGVRTINVRYQRLTKVAVFDVAALSTKKANPSTASVLAEARRHAESDLQTEIEDERRIARDQDEDPDSHERAFLEYVAASPGASEAAWINARIKPPVAREYHAAWLAEYDRHTVVLAKRRLRKIADARPRRRKNPQDELPWVSLDGNMSPATVKKLKALLDERLPSSFRIECGLGGLDSEEGRILVRRRISPIRGARFEIPKARMMTLVPSLLRSRFDPEQSLGSSICQTLQIEVV